MKTDINLVLNQLQHDLAETRTTVCVDGDSTFQCGFFMGFDLAQSVLEALAKEHRVTFL